MEPFRYHVYVCQQEKPGTTLPSCSARGALQTLEALRKEIATQGLTGDVQITTCGSLGMCERGPNLVVYPEGVWYSGVTASDVPELVREHFKNGRPLERLVNRDAAALKKEIEENRAKAIAAMQAAQRKG